MLWIKLYDKYVEHPRYRGIAAAAGCTVGVVSGVFIRCLMAAKSSGRTGTVPELQVAAIAEEQGVEPSVVDAVLEGLRREGIIDRRGRIAGWEADQLSEEERKKLQSGRERNAAYVRACRARKRGEPAPEPQPAPASKPEPEPKKPAAPAPSGGREAGMLPGIEPKAPKPATPEKPKKEPRAPKAPRMSEETKRVLFDAFWAAAGDASQSSAGAWAWWRKAVWSAEKAGALTDAARRAQALQDARGLSRYNVINWLRTSGYAAPVCTDEAAFQAELAKAGASRRGPAPKAGGVSDAFGAAGRIAAMLGGGVPAANVEMGGTAVLQEECYDCAYEVVSSGDC